MAGIALRASTHSSSVGLVIDVARHSRTRLLISSCLCALTGPPLAVGAFGLLSSQGLPIVVAVIAAIVVLWASLLGAVSRFRAAFEPNCYFRAGRGGISLRVPGTATPFFTYKMIETDVPWRAVTKWYPYLHTINVAPIESAVVVETTSSKLTIEDCHFKESRRRIVANIQEALKTGFASADRR
jgi:hypothetical protein